MSVTGGTVAEKVTLNSFSGNTYGKGRGVPCLFPLFEIQHYATWKRARHAGLGEVSAASLQTANDLRRRHHLSGKRGLISSRK